MSNRTIFFRTHSLFCLLGSVSGSLIEDEMSFFSFHPALSSRKKMVGAENFTIAYSAILSFNLSYDGLLWGDLHVKVFFQVLCLMVVVITDKFL